MRRRPTIPISYWSLALDLDATKHVQRLSENPAEGCNCESCANWRAIGSSVLPTALKQEIQRAGCSIEFPADSYIFEQSEGRTLCRIVYFIVGKILSGPNAMVVSQEAEENSYNYQCLRENPWLTFLVMRQRDYHGYSPAFDECRDSEAIRLDLRLEVPFGDSQ